MCDRVVEDQSLQGTPRQAHLYPELLQGHLRSAVLGSSTLARADTLYVFPWCRLHTSLEEGRRRGHLCSDPYLRRSKSESGTFAL